jgi:predicted transglutaminase-like protease
MWGNESNRFTTSIGNITFETINTVGEDRLIRATIPLTVYATLLSEQEARVSTLKKMYSVKQVTFEYIFEDTVLFTTTTVPQKILQSGTGTIVTGGGNQIQITTNVYSYLINLRDEIATYINSTTVTLAIAAAVNPVTNVSATKNEFDVFINGQYIDKICYTWTPTDASSQTIIFDTNTLGYTLSSTDVVVVKGRWA